jgi:hypothetical protein
VVHSREAKCFATAISGSGMQDSVSVFYVYSQDDKKLVAKEVLVPKKSMYVSRT